MSVSRLARQEYGRQIAALLDDWVTNPYPEIREQALGELYELLVQRGRHIVHTYPRREVRDAQNP